MLQRGCVVLYPCTQMKIAIQGELGAFSHEACRRNFPRAKVVPCAVSSEVFEALESGRVDAALIPIENTLAGPVVVHYDLLLEHDFYVNAEFRLRIEHQLLAVPGTKFGEIREVLSHPVALDQCRKFFAKNKKVRSVSFYDTAGAARHVMEEGKHEQAAIASRVAGEVYGAEVLQSNLEDDAQNFTRFVLVERRARANKDANKVSVAVGLPNKPGMLFKALSVFALREIDLTKIESRPVRGRPWEYAFFLDFMQTDKKAAENALRHLEEIAQFVKVLGRYRSAE
ncbi:prephenate dehydratase [Candidatus Koribacter versatilis Ellin345]|uniref:Prephenate dehydratase n=2 Tax=Candidatus Korobacter versatilis TaxID=658062 RepID=Q1IQ06_KORVE|nr:prephenate dehydratase [Candidatus Koribacter versatilis Ellin345]